MFLAGIATWAVLAQPCVYCFILPRASEHHFRRCSSAHHFLPRADWLQIMILFFMLGTTVISSNKQEGK